MSKINRKKVGFAAALIGVYLAFFAVGSLLGGRFGVLSSTPGLSWQGDGQVNILFMGIDARPPQTNARSDTMILASIDKQSSKAVLIWIPRDTRIEVSKGRYDKINSVNAVKGPEAACEAVGKLLNTEVDYYVLTNFQGFSQIIDTLGGVHIDVETNMRHSDPDPTLNINLAKGPQVLNGADALRYVRYRGGPTADIGRTARQQKFIKAVMAEMFTTKNIFKLPELAPQLLAQVKTNLPAKEVTTLASLAQKFNTGNVITQTLPGYSFTEASSGASYWHADENITPRIIAALFAGETFEVIKDPPNWVAQLPKAKPAEGEAPAVVKTPEAIKELEQAGQPEVDKPADSQSEGKEGGEQDPEVKDGDTPVQTETGTKPGDEDKTDPEEENSADANKKTGDTPSPDNPDDSRTKPLPPADPTGSAGYTG
jgi:LCP family protein required for cell wall assembly